MNKIKFSIVALLMALSLSMFTTGCLTAKTPAPTADNPNPGPVYSPSPAITNRQAQFQTLWQAAAPAVALTPAAPVAPFVPSIADGIFGLIALVSGGLATWKNSQAKGSKKAASALAATVAAQPAGTALAMTNAAANGSTAEVARHLADAQNPVQL